MKLWDKGVTPDDMIQDFTTGRDRMLDTILAKYDIIGSIAHVRMLHAVKIISESDFQALIKGLFKILNEVRSEEFVISDDVEDVHSEVEKRLTEMLGEAGKKIHAGRSRNDQVLLDIHLFIRDKIYEIVNEVGSFSSRILELSDKYSDFFLPGYTHFQAAMPSSFPMTTGTGKSSANPKCKRASSSSVSSANPA